MCSLSRWIWLTLLFSLASTAFSQDYQREGLVNQVEGKNTVIIDYVEYQLNPQVRAHTPLPIGEYGPLLKSGMRVGINTSPGNNGNPVITDIWLLENE